jgi:hypothetical protein
MEYSDVKIFLGILQYWERRWQYEYRDVQVHMGKDWISFNYSKYGASAGEDVVRYFRNDLIPEYLAVKSPKI